MIEMKFDVVKKGYDKEQVEAYYQRMKTAYKKLFSEYEKAFDEEEILSKENLKLKEENEKMKKELELFSISEKEKEKLLAEAKRCAEETARRVAAEEVERRKSGVPSASAKQEGAENAVNTASQILFNRKKEVM